MRYPFSFHHLSRSRVERIMHALYTFGGVRYDFSERTHLMGILNVTPDSFSDAGQFYGDIERAVRRGVEMAEEGADFIDIGGESSRPGSEPVSVGEELRRVVPVIERLAKEVSIPLSIDTCKHEVAERALDAGAVIVNDITGLHFDPALAGVTARKGASIVLMHMKGSPKTMQQTPHYDDVIEEICSYLEEGIRCAQRAGIGQIIIDPGIGFGKTLQHNLTLFRRLGAFHRFGVPVLAGPSRKSFLNTLLGLPVGERLIGTAAAVAASIQYGAHIVRVHDVKEMKQVATVTDAIMRA